jgi:hypothetical protein
MSTTNAPSRSHETAYATPVHLAYLLQRLGNGTSGGLMALALHPGELWLLRHGGDAVRCVANPHPMGVEVRYVINESPLMARVLPDWKDVRRVANMWRKRLERSGWVPAKPRRSARRH